MNPATNVKRLGVGDAGHVVKCNHCKVLVLNEHRVAHALECRQRRNKTKLEQLNLAKNGQSLYAVAIARKKKGDWVMETHHVHAVDVPHARHQFWAGEPNRKSIKIIEIGLAIGWFQDDQTGVISG